MVPITMVSFVKAAAAEVVVLLITSSLDFARSKDGWLACVSVTCMRFRVQRLRGPYFLKLFVYSSSQRMIPRLPLQVFFCRHGGLYQCILARLIYRGHDPDFGGCPAIVRLEKFATWISLNWVSLKELIVKLSSWYTGYHPPYGSLI